MKLVVQRVKKAQVEVREKIVGEIKRGLFVLVGIGQGDTKKQAEILAKKLVSLRIFEDENEKMNLDIKQVKGQILIISQFTLYGDCSSGNRPSFIQAARPEQAIPLYEYFIEQCKNQGVYVQTGIFGADMQIEAQNDGPVTILLEK